MTTRRHIRLDGPLRDRTRRRVFRADPRTAPYYVRWQVLKQSAPGREPAILDELRRAARFHAAEIGTAASRIGSECPGGNKADGAAGREKGKVCRAAATSNRGGTVTDTTPMPEALARSPLAVGVRSVGRGLERGNAMAVIVCSEAPSALIQHLPVMCALRKVPVAIIAASPFALANAIAPCCGPRYGKRSHAAAVGLLQTCAAYPKFAQLAQHLQKAAPDICLPFLLPAGGAPSWPSQKGARHRVDRARRSDDVRMERAIDKTQHNTTGGSFVMPVGPCRSPQTAGDGGVILLPPPPSPPERPTTPAYVPSPRLSAVTSDSGAGGTTTRPPLRKKQRRRQRTAEPEETLAGHRPISPTGPSPNIFEFFESVV